MVVHKEDPGPFELDIDKDIDEGIVTGSHKVLPVKLTCGRHIGVWMIESIVNGIGAKLKIKPSVGGFELEKMLEIKC